MANRHVHADLIHAWCEGAEIEHWQDGIWEVSNPPMWREVDHYRIKDPYRELKAAAADPTKQIRCNGCNWTGCGYSWDWSLPPERYEIRDKPKPKKQIKLLAWFDGTTLFLRTEDCHYLSCQRVPSEDKVIEVEQ